MRALSIAAVLLFIFVGMGPASVDANNPIRPGDLINGVCTMAFIFDGQEHLSGKVYAISAAHCFSRVGQSVSTGGHPNFGTVVYMGNDANTRTDFALIEIKSSAHGSVVASVSGHPQYPTGVTSFLETRTGDLLQFSGWGTSFSFTPLTRENRVGVLTTDNVNEFYLAGPLDFGDSGGPIVHIATGKALGIESRVGVPFGSDTGPTIEGILNRLDAAGYPLVIRTA